MDSKQKITGQRAAIRIAMLADNRVPRGSIGYVDDLKPDCTTRILADRLSQLSKYVPDLVKKFEEAEW